MSASPTVGIFMGNNIDESATPPSSERNRLVADLVLHHACVPFMKETSVPPSSPWDTYSHPPESDVFFWYSKPFPVVGLEECCLFHEKHYIQYLKVRETLSNVDERHQLSEAPEVHRSFLDCPPSSTSATASNVSRMRVESARPPSFSRRVETALPTDASPSTAGVDTPPPLRPLPDLIPIEQDTDYELTGDATPFLGLWRTVTSTLSGTLTALRWLLEEDERGVSRFAAIHWFGGRHHAKRSSGGGFCFVNDVVIAALEWRRWLSQRPKLRPKLLLIDLDAHHGDGTESAFLFDPCVHTLSAHAYGTGVYPHSGEATSTGKGLGRQCNLNLPLPTGTTDTVYVPLTRQAIRTAVHRIGKEQLGGVILVCGADGLQGDPLGCFNLSLGGLQSVCRLVIDLCDEVNCPLLVLGAGGYVDTSTAKLCSIVTRDVLSCAAHRRSPSTITDRYQLSPWLTQTVVPVPSDCFYFTRYGPSFLLHGLPAARHAKVNTLSPDHPYYSSWQRLLAATENNKRESDSEDED